MPDLEISKLPGLSGAALEQNDPLPITDTSAATTKKITAKDLVQNGLQLIDDGSIPAEKVQGGGGGGGAVDSVNGKTGNLSSMLQTLEHLPWRQHQRTKQRRWLYQRCRRHQTGRWHQHHATLLLA